jgi:hypothetical protein
MVMTSLGHIYYRNIHMERLKKTKRIASKVVAIQTGTSPIQVATHTYLSLATGGGGGCPLTSLERTDGQGLNADMRAQDSYQRMWLLGSARGYTYVL